MRRSCEFWLSPSFSGSVAAEGRWPWINPQRLRTNDRRVVYECAMQAMKTESLTVARLRFRR